MLFGFAVKLLDGNAIAKNFLEIVQQDPGDNSAFAGIDDVGSRGLLCPEQAGGKANGYILGSHLVEGLVGYDIIDEKLQQEHQRLII